MIRRLLTLAALILPIIPASSAAAASTPLQTSGCAEYTERSVSTGAVRQGVYRIAAYCFTGSVSGSQLRIAGRSVDGSKDTLCTQATTLYTTRGVARAVKHPLNCSGGVVQIKRTTLRDVSSAHIEVCIVEKPSLRPIICSGKNQIHPAVVGNGSRNRR